MRNEKKLLRIGLIIIEKIASLQRVGRRQRMQSRREAIPLNGAICFGSREEIAPFSELSLAD